MRAVVYHGPGNKAREEVRTPSLIDDTDAIVRVDAVTICGTDLHILKGDIPAVTPGRILGHEAGGTIESGSSPRRRSTAPKRSTWRIPFADTSTYLEPPGVSDEQLLMLTDILPTGYEVGVLNGRVRPGDVVAVVGAGPIGLAVMVGARLFSPSHVVAIDLADSRLDAPTGSVSMSS